MTRARAMVVGALALVAACASARVEERLGEEREAAGPLTDPVASPADVTPEPTWGDPVSWGAVTAEVLAKNPRVEAMRSAWRAMLERVPQVTASPDPTLELGIAPLSLPTGMGQRLSFRQPLAWGGQLDRRAEVVFAEADALRHDREAMQRELVAMAHEALIDLGVASELRALYLAHHELVDTLRRGALARVATGRGQPEDAVRAEGELVMIELRLHEVDRMERVARARVNALVHRAIEAPIGTVILPAALPPAPPALDDLLAEARAGRPELAAAASRVRARMADGAVADSMGWPMLGVGAELSTMSEDAMMWPMLMFMIELPLASGRRAAMRDEARAMAAMARAEAAALADEIGAEVASRRASLEAALASHDTIERTLLPLLVQRQELTLAGYAANRADFDAVVMATDALLDARLERVMWRRDAHMAAVALERALGRLVAQPAAAPTLPERP
ncbi:MAG: TolC family protein [Deltaproteobacteria bacterium]|nr:TolC family protein [Deltaproteobacteria bacterium]